ncbi:MAG: ABC transporter ATP-binding protein [Kiritimatiellae bacterium]|nr:ABC transporter ATP-binding protein [Kiritimatiellia bacterium]
MLKFIQFCPNHSRRIKLHKRLSFEPGVTMLIGPNGSGKSTILRAIANCAECRRTEDGATEYILLDTEAMNPRFNTDAAGNYMNMLVRSRAMFSSHGQSLRDLLRLIKFTPQSCILLDEPETAQDLDNIIALRNSMDHAAARGAQIICSSHHVAFWNYSNIVEMRRGYRKRITGEIAGML